MEMTAAGLKERIEAANEELRRWRPPYDTRDGVRLIRSKPGSMYCVREDGKGKLIPTRDTSLVVGDDVSVLRKDAAMKIARNIIRDIVVPRSDVIGNDKKYEIMDRYYTSDFVVTERGVSRIVVPNTDGMKLVSYKTSTDGRK